MIFKELEELGFHLEKVTRHISEYTDYRNLYPDLNIRYVLNNPTAYTDGVNTYIEYGIAEYYFNLVDSNGTTVLYETNMREIEDYIKKLNRSDR